MQLFSHILTKSLCKYPQPLVLIKSNTFTPYLNKTHLIYQTSINLS